MGGLLVADHGKCDDVQNCSVLTDLIGEEAKYAPI